MKVTMIHEGNMSYPDPPLDPEWDERVKLEWKAALVESNTGIRVRVTDGSFAVGGVELGRHHNVVTDRASIVLPFDLAWMYLTGVEAGARAARA